MAKKKTKIELLYDDINEMSVNSSIQDFKRLVRERIEKDLPKKKEPKKDFSLGH